MDPKPIGYCAFCGEPAAYLAADGTKVCKPCSEAYKPNMSEKELADQRAIREGREAEARAMAWASGASGASYSVKAPEPPYQLDGAAVSESVGARAC